MVVVVVVVMVVVVVVSGGGGGGSSSSSSKHQRVQKLHVYNIHVVIKGGNLYMGLNRCVVDITHL